MCNDFSFTQLFTVFILVLLTNWKPTEMLVMSNAVNVSQSVSQ